MVNLLIVSHSARLAAGVKELSDQMTGGLITIGAVGGAVDGSLGTSPEAIWQALQALASPDGILVLVDLGSAVLSVQLALEDLGQLNGAPVVISDAPLVEGAYLAAVEASTGASLHETAAAARKATELKKVLE